MRIIELTASNFKRLKAVRISPDGTLCQITGKNAAGKSSVLDAVWAALGGKEASPDRPIREGADRASVTVDMGDIKVTRKWTGNDKSTLVVESRDGLTYKSPQSVLDALVGRLSFDPLAFQRMDAPKQAATLRQLAGLDVRAEDAESKRLYDQRTLVNRDAKNLEGQLAGMQKGAAPDAELSISELAGQHREAVKQIGVNGIERRRLAGMNENLTRITREVEQLELNLAAARERLADMKALAEAKALEVATLADPDLDAISAQMETAEATNAVVRANRARAAKREEWKAKTAEAAALTEKIDAIDAAKVAKLAAAKFPVDGLSVDGETVTFKGIPFAQASTAEQIRVCLAICAALNPKLRVVLVRDGSLLDSDAMRLIAGWAEREKMQVLMERVADDGDGVGVVIEDGEVVGAPAVAELAPAVS